MKESESGHDTTRKSEKKNIQETIKQLHGNICIFFHSIEQLIAENETTLGKNESKIKFYYESILCSRRITTTFNSFTLFRLV